LRRGYLIIAIILFAIEVLIALYVRDDFIRPYLGDVLAVAFVYAALRAVTPLSITHALGITFTVAVAIEAAQALGLLAALGLANNTVARIVLGGVFDWADIVAYAAGIAIVALIERLRH